LHKGGRKVGWGWLEYNFMKIVCGKEKKGFSGRRINQQITKWQHAIPFILDAGLNERGVGENKKCFARGVTRRQTILNSV